VPILVGSTNPKTERFYGAQLLAPYLADATSVFVVSSDFCHWGTRFHYMYYLPHAPPAPAPSSSSASSSASSSSSSPATSSSPILSDFSPSSIGAAISGGYTLGARARLPKHDGATAAAIYDSIARLDALAMQAAESGSHDAFLNVLRATGNTVCGRHPIGVIMAAVEAALRDDSSSSSSSSSSITAVTTGEGASQNSSGANGGDDDNNTDDGDGERQTSSLKRGRFRFVRYERSSDVVKPSESSVSYASAFCVF
jgi:hypothetical protein